MADLRDNWSVPQTETQRLGAPIRSIHRKYLALACAATVTADGAPRSEYLTGCVEANYLSMVLALKGVENSSCVLLRQSIEMLLKHIYFSTHPVEYAWARARESYRELTYQYLLDYLRRTDEISRVRNSKQMVDGLDYYYGILSRYVHVHNRSFVGYQVFPESKKEVDAVVTMTRKITAELWPLLVVILIASLPTKFIAANAVERDLVRQGLPNKYRSLLDDLLKTIALESGVR